MTGMAVFEEISPADFFYRNRDIAGFSSPSRAIYSTLRELIENSLDACEAVRVLPEVRITLRELRPSPTGAFFYSVRVVDNGSGVPGDKIPQAFGQVLFGSKFRLKQTRGTFGLGGTMAILYGQITTEMPAHIVSSTGDRYIHDYELMIDIQKNKPNVLRYKVHTNRDGWHGTLVEFTMEGDYTRAMPKVLDYLKQTAIVNPYADITFVDPKGRLYVFERTIRKLPSPPKETLPHPYGVDAETLYRLIAMTNTKSLSAFLMEHFHRVGKSLAGKVLERANLDPNRSPKTLTPSEVSDLANVMRSFEDFLPPDASCLSPLGEEILEAGIRKELNPEFVFVTKRKPSAYSGYPFIVEVGIAYGGGIPRTGDIVLYRFANRIPLLYDETSDVSWKVIHNLMDWRYYKVNPAEDPLAIIIHLCSTKIPYKTVGKEFLSDRPEIEREILNGVRLAARNLMLYLMRKRRFEIGKKRFDLYARYLPKIARFSTLLSGHKKEPDIGPLLAKVSSLGLESPGKMKGREGSHEQSPKEEGSS
ncbi:DNA topoisomerase VI subunit B [Candidatus Bathyarchaeota archaeon]|nr:DNA topoisomerase VI subunit B [Candidatus Bathyarchaeota archaeon]